MVAASGSKENFDFLISKGTNLNMKDTLGNDLMYYAFKYYNNNKEVTQHFINQLRLAGIHGKNKYKNENTLAHIAIEKNSVFLLKEAIKMGTNINSKNSLSLSPLHLAAMKATNKELIDVLLKSGAKKNTLTDFDESPYDLALQNELLNKGNIDLAFLKIN
jgi:ankyrin repeat protein